MPTEKFTPGKWVANANGDIVNRQGLIIAKASVDETGKLSDEEKTANRQLIQTAPEMFNFIKDMYETAKRNGATYPILDNIYAKALGISL